MIVAAKDDSLVLLIKTLKQVGISRLFSIALEQINCVFVDISYVVHTFGFQ